MVSTGTLYGKSDFTPQRMVRISGLVPLSSTALSVHLFVAGFATLVMHDVTSHKTCRNVQVTHGGN